MYLKELALSGFKSFAVPTELVFVSGLTAVVGPNGSGKSNIADAIRWVLGEQSARTLRGGKMEDVIFSGSDSRHAVNYTEVSLTLDNSDNSLPLPFSEVSITRRLYRSGESEYFINRQPCRLKDITELLLDTGLEKESFAIIGQGQIDNILSTKAEDRRGIFESASGIVKYKLRKKEAERKLEETEQNLARISDLVYELKEQKEPLAEQAELAFTYRKLKEDLKQVEIALYVHKITTLHREWSEASERSEQLKQDELSLQTALKQQEAVLEQYKWQLQQLEETRDTIQRELLAVSEAAEKTEGQRDVLVERTKNEQGQQRRLKEQIAATKERLTDAREQFNQVQKQVKAKKKEVVATEKALEEQERQRNRLGAEISEQLEEVKAEIIESLSESASLENECRHLREQEREQTERVQTLTKRKRHIEEQLAGCVATLEQLEEKRANTTKKLEAVKLNYRSLEEKRERVIESEKKLSTVVRQLEQKMNELSSRLTVIDELDSSYVGFYQGVKEVLKAKKRGVLKGVEGAVAELIHVPARLEVAVETALGSALQHIVVSNERHGRSSIAYLKQHRLGRATFLPMEVIRPRGLAADERKQLGGESGFVGVALELVQFDDRYRDIMAYLLGHVVVANDMESASRLARRLNYRYRIVTLDGDVVNPGGSMSGGSRAKQNGNVLSRKRKREQLTREIAGCEREKVEVTRKMEQQASELKAIERQLEQLRSEGETLKIDEQKIKSALDHKRAEAQATNEQLRMVERDIEQVVQLIEQTRSRLRGVESRWAESRSRSEQLKSTLNRLEREMTQQEAMREAVASAITNLKVALARQMKEQEHLQDNEHRLQQECEKLEKQLAELQQVFVTVEQKIVEYEAEEERIVTRIEKLKRERSRLQQKLTETQAARTSVQHEFQETEAVCRNYRKELASVQEKFRQREVRISRLDVQLNHLLNALSEQYEISFELAKSRYPVPEDVQQAEEQVTELKEKIRGLGDVNLGAIEEYERVCERLSFLEKQRDDLVEAKASLYDVIREMDDEMSRRFKETFNGVREHFQRVFSELFGGGYTDLKLTDPEAVLETGIDIVAQPPGKKLQQLTLLSGGERTLTAIALLFAILRVRPVPFCVLDEVEAALDEANVVRFARYLREFSDATQFIVITHRKRTMEAADVLYGVTMQESGVSTIVSVKLDGDVSFAERETASAKE